MLAVTHLDRQDGSVYTERPQWARSYAKLIGTLESPRRGVFLITPLGKTILAMPYEQAQQRVLEMDREFRRNRPRKKNGELAIAAPAGLDTVDEAPPEDADSTDSGEWRDIMLARLHELSPDGFEEFVLYLLRLYGLELERVGGTGDEGIDGIGTAPISAVLSSRVAVQVKRYEPGGRPVGRETVALFQRDAQTKGAERAILVSPSRFTEAARRAASATSPNVDLIDGARLAELTREQGLGVRDEPRVDPAWFDRFD